MLVILIDPFRGEIVYVKIGAITIDAHNIIRYNRVSIFSVTSILKVKAIHVVKKKMEIICISIVCR